MTPSQPFWPSVERLPTFTGSLTTRPSGWAGRTGAGGAGAGATGCGLGSGGGGCGETGMMGVCPVEGLWPGGMRTMSTPEPATLEIGGGGPSSRGGGPKACAPQPVVAVANITTAVAMLDARKRCEDGARRASVIVEAPRQDILGRGLARHFLGPVLGSFLRLRFSPRFLAVLALPPRFLSARSPLLPFAGLGAGRLGWWRGCGEHLRIRRSRRRRRHGGCLL